MRRKTICILAALGAVLGGGILLGSTVSASAVELETPDVPVATAVTSMTGEPGWQNEYGVRRYFDESGNAVTGEQEIDGVYYLFDYTGVQPDNHCLLCEQQPDCVTVHSVHSNPTAQLCY